MIRRISTQRHGHSESLVRDDKRSSFTAVNEVSAGTEEVVADENVSNANTFAGPGNFGKMFPTATPFRPTTDDGLIALAGAMTETSGNDPEGNAAIPAGFTYLGQFIDHDITFDKTVGLPQIDDPQTIEQARTPNLDLDSLYGFGPGSEVDGAMYEGAAGSEVFKIGLTVVGGGDPSIPADFPNDLNRHAEDQAAFIPDPRNDENLVVAQTHLAFMKFHNQLIATLPPTEENGGGNGDGGDGRYYGNEGGNGGGGGGGGRSLFDRARELVTWHYQWIVLHDFVKRITQESVFNDVLANGRKFYRFEEVGNGKAFMPIEFSVAAYRLGHSMIRKGYDYNRVFRPGGVAVATLQLLFRFSSGGDLPVPSDWIMDWRRFHEVGDFGGVGNFTKINPARKIDTRIADPLTDLIIPGKVDSPPASLTVRNLLRGSRLGLGSGQDIAGLMGITPLTAAELTTGHAGQAVGDNGFKDQTPLWFYILKEAEVQENGERMGEMGSRIVAEVFVGLLQGDPNSFMSKGWTPSDSTIPRKDPDNFTMADMLLFIKDISPIDGITG